MSTNPNTVKSQHELTNEGGRKSDVLLSTIEELERTKKQLDIAVNCLKQYANRDNWYNIYKPNSLDECPIASKERWKKEYGYKQAEKALGKIEELNK